MKVLVDPQVPAWGEANKPRIVDFFDSSTAKLKDRDFIAGEHFSVADITALVAVDFMKVSKLAVPDDLKNVQRWHAAVAARPSAKA